MQIFVVVVVVVVDKNTGRLVRRLAGSQACLLEAPALPDLRRTLSLCMFHGSGGPLSALIIPLDTE